MMSQGKNLDHLGLVAGIIDEMGLVEQINQLLGQHPQERVSAGNVVKAMILNGLGFVSGSLYLFDKFFEGKATEHLIGEGVKPEYLNDDRLGRVLDQLYLSVPAQNFSDCGSSCRQKVWGINAVCPPRLHLISSTWTVQEYSAVKSLSQQGESIKMAPTVSRLKKQ